MASMMWKYVAAGAVLLLGPLSPPCPLYGDEASTRAELESINQRVVQLYGEGQFEAAIPSAERSLELASKTFGADHLVTATSLDNLAGLFVAMGRYAEAEPLHQRALRIFEAKLGADHLDTAFSLNNLAGLYKTMGRYSEAEPHYQRALKIREAKLGPDHPHTAQSLHNLAGLYEWMGRYLEAEPLYQRALKIREAKLGPDHLDTARNLYKLGGLYESMARYAEAEPLYQRALKIREAKLSADHPDIANCLHNLALLYHTTGRHEESESLYRRALKISEARLGADHPDTAGTLHNLATLYVDMGRYAESESLIQRALRIREARLGADHPDTAVTLNSLATLYVDMGRYAESESLFRRALKINEAKIGTDHPYTAGTLNSLAWLYESMGRNVESEDLYHRALEIREAKLGVDHPEIANTLTSLARLHAVRGRWVEAMSGIDRARHSLLRHLHRVLPSLAENEQLAFLKKANEGSLHIAFSLARFRVADPAASDLSAGWVLNGKGLAQQTLAERALMARGDKNPATAKAAAELREVRSRLAATTLAKPNPGREAERKETLDELGKQEWELSKAVGQAMGRPVRDEPWVELDAVRKALSTDTMLVEIARFEVFNFQEESPHTRWRTPHYAAWLIPGAEQGDVRVIDLGPAQAIDAAIRAARKALKVDTVDLRDLGEPEVEQQARGSLEVLAKLVLKPLLPYIGGAKKWVVSPDAGLWLIPWAALPLDADRYVVEAHEVRYVISGRDLVAAAGTPSAGQALMMADPDFGLDPGAALAATRAVLREAAGPAPRELAVRGTSNAPSLGVVPRLPGTAAEAKAIAPKLKAFAGSEPIAYVDRYALEGVFKAFQHPRAVVMSTHGFFLAEQGTAPDNTIRPLMERKPPIVKSANPLLRCGLLLAGCNQGGGGGEDGVLTGLEIVGTDLQGTELVVLSACETGLGDVRNGEGVAGLRQAFQLAGVQSVVATLWQIPDRESARLMTSFFDKLSTGMGKCASLREAQLEQIASRRTRNGGAHPFFWAAYTLTGRGD